MIVIDASVVVAALVAPGALGAAAQRHLDADRIAPELIDIEVLHVVRRMVRHGQRTDEFGERALRTLASSRIERIPHRALLGRAWELRHNLTAYDATYVALAELMKTSLVTGDVRLARAPGLRCAVEVLS